MLLRRWHSAPGLVAVLVLSTCCDHAAIPEDAGIDGGRDASTAPRDAARADAPRDVGSDIGVDVRFEGDPEFVPLPLPGVTDERDVVLRAQHPERFPVANWYPCTGSVPSCRQLERTPSRARPYAIFATERGIWSWMLAVSTTRETYDAIGPIEGPLAGIWRRPLRDLADGGVSFGATWQTASQATAAFAVTHVHDGLYDERVYVAPLDDIGAVESPRYVVDLRVRGRGIQRMWVNDSYLLAEIQPDLSLYLWRLDQETFQIVDDRAAVPGQPQNEALVGGRVFYEAWNALDETRLAATGWDLPTRPVVDLTPSDIGAFLTDGRDMAWLQLHDQDVDGNYARIELWTMPYADDPDVASNARVLDSAFPVRAYEPLLGGGLYAYYWREPEGVGRVTVVPLSATGPLRYFQTPDGANISALLYLDSTNLIVRSGPDLYWVDPRELPEL